MEERRAFALNMLAGGQDTVRRRFGGIAHDLVETFEEAGVISLGAYLQGETIVVTVLMTDEHAWDRVRATDAYDRWAESLSGAIEAGPDGAFVETEIDELTHVETIAGLDEAVLDTPVAEDEIGDGLPELGQLPPDDPRLLGGGG